MNEIPLGYCQCGCGGRTEIARRTLRKHGTTRGEPRRFIAGHWCRGSGSPTWKGGRREIGGGYVGICMPEHPSATSSGYVLEHIVIVEDVLGKPLPPKAEVHHVNGIKSDNRNTNLVVCEDHAYHFLLERRARAYDETGHAHWLRCPFCKTYDDPDQLYITPGGRAAYHMECRRSYDARRRRRIGIPERNLRHNEEAAA